VADGVSTLLDGDLSQALGDAGTGVGGTQQVFLVNGAGLHARNDIFVNVFLGQIKHVQFGRTRLERLFLQALQFVRLTDITRYGDDLTVVIIFLEPRNDDGRIQTARVRKDYLFDIFFVHDNASENKNPSFCIQRSQLYTLSLPLSRVFLNVFSCFLLVFSLFLFKYAFLFTFYEYYLQMQKPDTKKDGGKSKKVKKNA
jgi:hypothetical protein